MRSAGSIDQNIESEFQIHSAGIQIITISC